MRIVADDLSGPEIEAFLQGHLDEMKSVTRPESMHALDLDGLRKPEIAFWTVWEDRMLVGCGALKTLDPGHAELKSMRTAPACRQKGIASALLRHILEEAGRRGFSRVSLETGAIPFFDRARKLYAKFGFVPCKPFSGYREDPHSAFMTKEL